MKLYVYLLVFCSVCIILGLIWDVSWHMSIGRDRFLTPPHSVVYFGAVVAALVSGYQVLQRSFFGTAAEKAASVHFWGVFYGPYGGLFCIWGAFAMLTSAPFDNWWHATYGLDQKIFSPPHVLLITGMMAIQLGSYITVAGVEGSKHWPAAIAGGSLLATLYTLFSERLEPAHMHYIWFYLYSSVLFPFCLLAFSGTSSSKWGATAAAAIYMAELLGMMWVLPLFPAKPQLGPVFNHFDHFQPFNFPLWLIVPAVAIDLVVQRGGERRLLKPVLASLCFVLLFFVVQWYFGEFYVTSVYTRGWVFASYSLNYASNPKGVYRYAFDPLVVTHSKHLFTGVFIAVVFGIISGTVGYFWGGWLKKIRR